MNIAYGEEERRSLIARVGLHLGLTVAALIQSVITLGTLAIVARFAWISNDTRLYFIVWPVLLLQFSLALAILYRYAPCRAKPRWQWVSWGAALASIGWAAMGAVFTKYAADFANYQETYGTLGGVMILLMWLYLSALVIVLGAELNSEIEAQTHSEFSGD